MKGEITLTEETKNLFRKHGTIIQDKKHGKVFVYLPYWVEMHDDGSSSLISWEKAPKNLKDIANKIRDIET